MKCRICGCTDFRACPAGCSWAPYPAKSVISGPIVQDLCTVCDAMIKGIVEYIDRTHSISQASVGRMYHEALRRKRIEPPTRRRRK